MVWLNSDAIVNLTFYPAGGWIASHQNAQRPDRMTIAAILEPARPDCPLSKNLRQGED